MQLEDEIETSGTSDLKPCSKEKERVPTLMCREKCKTGKRNKKTNFCKKSKKTKKAKSKKNKKSIKKIKKSIKKEY